MLSDSQKVGLRLQRQITLSKPATQVEDPNANARETKGFTRAGMAGPTNMQHPERERPRRNAETKYKQQNHENRTRKKKERRIPGLTVYQPFLPKMLLLGYLHHV